MPLGGFAAGVLQGLGQYAQQQNTLNLAAQVKANEDMAQFLDKQASVARTPEEAINFAHMAARYRTLGAKKPGKDLDLHGMFTQRNVNQMQQMQQQAAAQNSIENQARNAQIAQAQNTVQQGVLPSPDTVAMPGGGMASQAPQPQIGGIGGLLIPQQSTAAPAAGIRRYVTPQEAAAQRQTEPGGFTGQGNLRPGTSGISIFPEVNRIPIESGWPGGTVYMNANPSGAASEPTLAANPGQQAIAQAAQNTVPVNLPQQMDQPSSAAGFGLPQPPTPQQMAGDWVNQAGAAYHSPFRTGAEIAEENLGREARLAGYKAAAEFPFKAKEYQAQYESMYGAMGKKEREVFDAKIKSLQGMMEQLKNNATGNHFKLAFDMNGPKLTEDPGVTLPRLYLGTNLPKNAVMLSGEEKKDDATYTLIRYADGTLAAMEAATPLGVGYDANGNAVPYNRYVPESLAAAGVVAPSQLRPNILFGPSGAFFQSAAGARANVPGTPLGGVPASVLPKETSGIKYMDGGVDAQGNKILIPVPTRSTRQTGGITAPSAIAPPAGGMQPSMMRVGETPANQQGARPTPTTPKNITGGISSSLFNAAQNRGLAVKTAATQLWGDPDNPGFKGLADYSYLADKKDSRERISKAVNLMLSELGAEGTAALGAGAGPVHLSAGGIGQVIQNALNIPQKQAEQKARIIGEAISSLKPDEQEYFDRLMASMPTVTGLRKLTGGSAFKWSQQALERELPFIGLSAMNSEQYNNKLRSLGEEVVGGSVNIPASIVNPKLIENIRTRIKQIPKAPNAITPAVPIIKTKAEYDALPSNSIYMEEDGKRYRKP